jgi:hypothetical protein
MEEDMREIGIKESNMAKEFTLRIKERRRKESGRMESE